MTNAQQKTEMAKTKAVEADDQAVEAKKKAEMEHDVAQKKAGGLACECSRVQERIAQLKSRNPAQRVSMPTLPGVPAQRGSTPTLPGDNHEAMETFALESKVRKEGLVDSSSPDEV